LCDLLSCVPNKYITPSVSSAMAVLLYAYVVASLASILPFSHAYILVQPALVTLFFVSSQVLSERPFF